MRSLNCTSLLQQKNYENIVQNAHLCNSRPGNCNSANLYGRNRVCACPFTSIFVPYLSSPAPAGGVWLAGSASLVSLKAQADGVWLEGSAPLVSSTAPAGGVWLAGSASLMQSLASLQTHIHNCVLCLAIQIVPDKYVNLPPNAPNTYKKIINIEKSRGNTSLLT